MGTIRYQQKRGSGTPNPIKLAKLKIRLVYPPDKVVPVAKITDRPAKNVDYTLTIRGEKRYELKGTTDGDGILEEEVPAGVKWATLTLHMAKAGDKKKPNFWQIELWIGNLDSVHKGSDGIAARLNNLGLFISRGIPEDSPKQTIRGRSRFISLFGVPDGTYVEDEIEKVYGS